MGTIGPTTNHNTGTDDRPLAFEVTRPRESVSRNRGRRNVVGPVVLVLFQTEKNVNKPCIFNFVRPARRPRRCRPYLNFQLPNHLSHILTFPLSHSPIIKHSRESVSRNCGEKSNIKNSPLFPLSDLSDLCVRFLVSAGKHQKSPPLPPHPPLLSPCLSTALQLAV